MKLAPASGGISALPVKSGIWHDAQFFAYAASPASACSFVKTGGGDASSAITAAPNKTRQMSVAILIL
jgi:hypothetical protein